MYTKHYYAGSSRIASRIGGGFVAHRDLNDYSPVATADRVPLLQTSSYDHKAENLRNLWARAGECMGVSLEYAYSLESSGLYLNPTETADGERYFYHSDHLGSSAFVTTENGYATQFLAYMPYGETLAEQQNGTSYYSPFKFSAKEKDPETGYSYFGARYYSPELSVWLSVDPKAAEMPDWSPYSFSFNNPISFTDPDGMKPTPSQAASMAWHIYDGKKGQVVDGWTLWDVYKDKNNPGYKAGLYIREVDGVMEYTMVNMGTIPGTGKKNRDSMSEDLEQPFGGSEHMKLSLDKARELNNTLGPDADLTFVGHSKGGAEAAANAVATNRDAYVFNPAAVNLKAYGLSSKYYTASMTAFVVKGDPVAATYPILFAKPIDKLIMLPRQSWTNPIENHNNFGEALRQYLKNKPIQD